MWKIHFRRRTVILVGVILLMSSIIGSFAGTSPPGPGIANSTGSYNDPNGSLKQTQVLPFEPYNGTDNAQTHTITFDVLGIEQLQPPAGVVFTVSTTGSLITKFVGSKPTVTCGFCLQSYSGITETITYSGVISDILTVVWTGTLGLLTEVGVPSTLFKDTFLYTNTYLTNSWTIDRYGLSDSTPQTQGGYLWFSSSSSVAVQTAHVTSSSFNPITSGYSTNTIVKRKLTIGLIPFAAKSNSITSQLHLGLSTLDTIGVFPGSNPYGTPNVGYGTDSCNASANLNDNIGSTYIFAANTGYFEGDICGDPSGSKSAYALYTGDPTLFTVFTVETRAVFCSTCNDNALPGSAWTFFRVYQEDKNSNIISASDNRLNITGLQSGVLAPLANPTYSFISQHNNGVSGIVTKIALVDLQNYGSPVLLPPPPSNIPFPNCFFTCGIQGLINLAASYVGFGNAQLGAFILWGSISAITLMFIAVYTRAVIPTSMVGMCLTLMFIFGGFLPTVLAFFMLFGSGALMALTFYKVVTGSISSGGRG